MTTNEIIESIQAEIARLEQVRTLLSGRTPTPAKRGRPFGSPATSKPRRKMSAEGRARIAAAQRARWANTKRK
jgi:hypothetical protein